jgi:predicted Zn-dependent peptidase
MKKVIFWFFLIGLLSLNAIEFSEMKNQVKEINLENGAKILVIEDHSAPIVHCVTKANVGGVNEVPGITGIAHFLEHLAFKGSKTIGTSNYEQEKIILDKEDEVFDRLLKAQAEGNAILAEKLQNTLDSLEVEADKYAISNEFSAIYKQNGGENFNAATSQDFTFYQVSLPSNRVELWFNLESDRFTNPIFREFYKERSIILDERLMREVNSPQGKLMAKLYDTAFTKHPYKITTIGYEEDIKSITRQDVKDFFNKYYGAKNLLFILAGDITYEEAKGFADKYLSKIPSRTKTEYMDIHEPAQTAERRVEVDHNATPMVMLSYHIPAAKSEEFKQIQALASILGQGQTSPMFKSLVYDKKLAMFATCFAGLPGQKYDNLFSVICAPNQGVSIEDCITEIDNVIAEFLTKDISEEKIASYRKKTKKRTISSINTGIYLPIQIAMTDAVTENYKDFFNTLEDLEAVNAKDVKAVAQKYLKKTNRTVGILNRSGE